MTLLLHKPWRDKRPAILMVFCPVLMEVAMEKPWYKFRDVDLKTTKGWICPEGHFYPCEYMGHNDLMDDLIDAGYDTHLNGCVS